jgi:hypothetical protein
MRRDNLTMLLFAGGVQAVDPLAVPRIKLSATAQARMCGNSVAPAQAEALVRWLCYACHGCEHRVGESRRIRP